MTTNNNTSNNKPSQTSQTGMSAYSNQDSIALPSVVELLMNSYSRDPARIQDSSRTTASTFESMPFQRRRTQISRRALASIIDEVLDIIGDDAFGDDATMGGGP